METISASPGGPCIDDQWTDLEIRCQDRAFRVHRAIVCPQSEVLAVQCEAMIKAENEIANVIEYQAFDAQTVECMLRWMYEKDYRLTVEPVVNDQSTSTTSGDDSSGQLVLFNRAGTNTNADAVSHVRVYAIAQIFQLPKLQDFAMEKFAELDMTQDLDNFTGVLYEVYNHTTSPTDPLRQQTLIIALDAIDSLVHCDNFMNAISQEPSLQEFAPTILGAALRQAQSNVRDETAELLGSLTLSTNKEMEALSASYEEHLEEMKAKVSSEEAKAETLRRQVDTLGRDIGALEDQLKKATGEKASQSRQIEQLTRDVEMKTDAVSMMQLERSTANRALHTSNSISHAKQAQAEDAARKAKEMDEKHKAATNEASKMK